MSRLLSDILSRVPIVEISGDPEREIGKIEFDSRNLNDGDVFVAVPGTQVDGHRFIQQAVEQGVAAVVCQRFPEQKNNDICWVQVEDSSKALSLMASAFYDDPSEELNLAGITGTNGKTTTATLLYSLFKALGYKCGLLSTVRVYIDDKTADASHTTPDAPAINRYLREMVNAGCEYAFMEVSSHAIHQNRVAGLDFDLAIFSNITHDHLDYHKTFTDYIKAKKSFFDNLGKNAKALVNADDRNAKIMLQNTMAEKFTYALKKPANFKGKVLENSFEGLLMELDGRQLWSRLVGDFNASNLLAVYAAARLLDVDTDAVLRELSNLKAAEGRFEVIKSKDAKSAIVDYAHTPDALENVVKTIEGVRKPEQQLLVVVGAGGDRDRGKRPIMAEIAARYAAKIILTSDNPRSEKPEDIIADMREGIPEEKKNQLLEITDRRQAIQTACMLAQPGDIILVAGKGHETYQEIQGVKHHFDDKEIIGEIFKNQ